MDMLMKMIMRVIMFVRVSMVRARAMRMLVVFVPVRMFMGVVMGMFVLMLALMRRGADADWGFAR